MKKIFVFVVALAVLSVSAFGQKNPKLTNEESSKMTQDQRVLHEVDRKSKRGKKDVSMKKKIKIDKKQARKSKRMKQPKRKNGN
jgi:predicted small lipoprotein YifL